MGHLGLSKASSSALGIYESSDYSQILSWKAGKHCLSLCICSLSLWRRLNSPTWMDRVPLKAAPQGPWGMEDGGRSFQGDWGSQKPCSLSNSHAGVSSKAKRSNCCQANLLLWFTFVLSQRRKLLSVQKPVMTVVATSHGSFSTGVRWTATSGLLEGVGTGTAGRGRGCCRAPPLTPRPPACACVLLCLFVVCCLLFFGSTYFQFSYT